MIGVSPHRLIPPDRRIASLAHASDPKLGSNLRQASEETGVLPKIMATSVDGSKGTPVSWPMSHFTLFSQN